MDHHHPAFDLTFDDHRGQRPHRFMESSDITAAFREFFKPLRTGIRRGMSKEGQIYGIEMDACIPGEMLSTEWIPPATRGIADVAALADAARRRWPWPQRAHRRSQSRPAPPRRAADVRARVRPG